MEQKTATVRGSAVETWLTDLERQGWTIHHYETTGRPGGKVHVTATVTRTDQSTTPAPATPATPSVTDPVDQPVDGGLW